MKSGIGRGETARRSASSRLLVLGLDTATVTTSVGLVRGDVVVGEREGSAEQNHAAQLPEIVAGLLAGAEVGIADLDGVAVSVGPGSFTGIRVGIGFAKGLAFAAGIPVAGVSTLAALAGAAPGEPKAVAACLDARKGEVFLGIYRRQEAGLVAIGPERALEPAEAVEAIREELGSDGLVVGDAADRHPAAFARLDGSGIRCLCGDVRPSGAVVARLGAPDLASGESVGAVYLKAPAVVARMAQLTR